MNFFNNDYSFNESDLKMDFKYCKLITKSASFKICLLVNCAKHHYSNSNFTEGDKILEAIVSHLVKEKVPEHEFPLYVINLIVYVLLKKGMIENTLKVIKFSKILEVLSEINIFKK